MPAEIDPFDFDLNGTAIPENTKDQLIEFSANCCSLIIDLREAYSRGDSKSITSIMKEMFNLIPE
jgi:hypothetical protein